MKNNNIFYIAFLVLTLFISAKGIEKTPNTDEKEVTTWFNKEVWKGEFAPIPDKSINKQTFAKHYMAHKERWDKVFKFLAQTNLMTHEMGRVDLGDDVYIAFSLYDAKDEDKVSFETHKKYIDLQYIISGKEMMSVVPIDSVTVKNEYNPLKDVAFYNSVQTPLIQADSSNFFLFFPDEAHRPSVRCGNITQVRKVVAKILFE